jgi:hypothetical protein
MGGGSDGTPSVTSRFTSLFGAYGQAAPAAASASATVSAGPGGWVPSIENDCPGVQIRTGASTLAVTNKSGQQGATASDVRYQFTITQLARQCTLVGANFQMKVGMQGRVIVGPAGAPAQVDAPIRYAVVREGVEPKTVATKFRRVPVSMAAGELNVTFSDVEEDLTFPIPSQSEIDAYVVYVGFDEAGDRNNQRAAPKKAAPRPK